MSGSESSSTISLSSSVSAPEMTNRISLPASREILRTTRESLSNTCPSGTMRTSRMPACSSSSLRPKARTSRCSVRERSARVRSAFSSVRMACTPARTSDSSPTMLSRLSSLRMSTRTVCEAERSETGRSSTSSARLALPAPAAGA